MADTTTENKVEELDESVKSSLFEDDEDLTIKEDDPKEEEEKVETKLPANININLGNLEKRRGPGRPPKSEKEKEDDGVFSEVSEELLDSFDNLGDGFYLEVHRVDPKYFNGVLVEGFLEKTTDVVDFDYLRNKFGGGKYDIIKRGPKRYDKGRPVGIRAHAKKRIVVSGDPVVQKRIGATPDEKDPDITEKALNFGQQVMNKMQEEKEQDRRRADEVTKMLITGVNKNDNKEVVELMKATLEAQNKSLQLQLEAARQDAERARKEQTEERKQFTQQIMDIRRDMEKKAESSSAPMLELFKQQMQTTKDEQKNQISMLSEIFKNNISMMNQSSENNLKLITETNKMQIELLKNELQRVSTELNQTRVSNKGDLVSELKKFKMVKELFASEGGDGESEGVVDKILNRLPDLAEAIPGIAGLFSKGTPKLVSRAPVAELPQPMPIEQPTEQSPAPQETMGVQDQVKIAAQLKKFIEEMEDAIDDGIDPEKFAADNVIGKYDPEILKQIAIADVASLIQFLQDKVDTESPLATVKGRDFLRKLHGIIKSKIS